MARWKIAAPRYVAEDRSVASRHLFRHQSEPSPEVAAFRKRIAGATSATITPGNRVGLVPYNTFSLWNKYQFTPLWAAGVGVIYQTSSYASSDDTVQLPGFTRVDAAVYGKINSRTSWQINVENIFDQKYISTADGNNNITPGSPRAIRGMITAKF